MLRKPIVLLVLGLLCFERHELLAGETLPPASRWIPDRAILAVEVANPRPLLDAALSPKAAEGIAATRVYKQAAERPGFQQFMFVIRYLEARLGADWKTALGKLLGGGASWAVMPDGTSLFIVDSLDAEMLGKLHDCFVEFARADAAKQDQPNRVASADYRGVTGWTLGKDEAHAILGNRLVLANRPQMLKEVIDLRAGSGEGSLAALPGYQTARKAAGPDTVATAYLNLAALKKHPPIQKALAENPNPMATLLFAGLLDAVRESNWLALGLRIAGTDVSLEAAVDAKPSGSSSLSAFSWPSLPDEGALPNLSVPRQILGLSFFRDLHAFYAAKDKLFPERTSGLIFFENMMGIFFSGRDLTEDIMAQPTPHIRFVVAEQKYDPEIGTPRVQLPAFAAVFRLRKPKQYADIVEEAWQKAVGLVSVTRGQKAQLGLVIDRAEHQNTRYSFAYFPSQPEDQKQSLPTQFNFRPALVKMGEYLVLSSTDGLAKDLIDALKRESAAQVKPSAGVHTQIELNAAALGSVLRANRAHLIRQNMLDKGNSQEEAETQVDFLLSLVKAFGQAKLAVGAGKSGHLATLQLKLSPP